MFCRPVLLITILSIYRKMCSSSPVQNTGSSNMGTASQNMDKYGNASLNTVGLQLPSIPQEPLPPPPGETSVKIEIKPKDNFDKIIQDEKRKTILNGSETVAQSNSETLISTNNQQLSEPKFNCDLCFCPLRLSHNKEKCSQCNLSCPPDETASAEDNVLGDEQHLYEAKEHIEVNNQDPCFNCNCPADSALQKCESCSHCTELETQLKNINVSESDVKSGVEIAEVEMVKGSNSVTRTNENNEITTTIAHDTKVHGSILRDFFFMLTVPAVLIIAFFVYKKTKHFIHRRHLRTFLVDGMYSERNPMNLSDAIPLLRE